MADATLSRGSTNITFTIHREGGQLAIARDLSKPALSIKNVSRQEPRSVDLKSSVETITLLATLLGPSAYSQADALVEDLIKPHSDGEPLQLDLTDVTGFTNVFEVGVPSEDAIQVDYLPGTRDRVDVQFSLPVVDDTTG